MGAAFLVPAQAGKFPLTMDEGIKYVIMEGEATQFPALPPSG
jgi:hypothetical protein